MDRKVFEALSSANKLINHQLDCQKAAIPDIKKLLKKQRKLSISLTKRAAVKDLNPKLLMI